ncbi:MAG: hypothetical protein C4538_05735 [Nitrospiraceae bacterium]|nr:MAG: hypothetical protein C4538_05735 [Nitrospiraceae bacterium]
MGYEELIAYLRAEADNKIKKLWDDSHAEAEKIRSEMSERLVNMRQEHGKTLGEAVHKIRNDIFFEAQKKAREIKLISEQDISRRLFSLAASHLSLLRKERYEDIFSALARELPSPHWKQVRVSPGDSGLARRLFPDAAIIPDDSIYGGLEVCSEDAKICVANTFNKRLQRAWENILPAIMRDIYQETSHERHSPVR